MSEDPRDVPFDIDAYCIEYALNKRQAAFIEFYIQTFNQTKAAKLAGYATPHVDGNRLLSDARIKRAVNMRFASVRADTDEVLARVSVFARADIADFLAENGGLDIDAARERGITIAIKKYKVKTRRNLRTDHVETEIEFELHDPLRANELLGKYHRLWDSAERKPASEPEPEELSDAALQRIASAALEAGAPADDLEGLGDVPSGDDQPGDQS
jgi:hypothetical protein